MIRTKSNEESKCILSNRNGHKTVKQIKSPEIDVYSLVLGTASKMIGWIQIVPVMMMHRSIAGHSQHHQTRNDNNQNDQHQTQILLFLVLTLRETAYEIQQCISGCIQTGINGSATGSYQLSAQFTNCRFGHSIGHTTMMPTMTVIVRGRGVTSSMMFTRRSMPWLSGSLW